jgi:hypothetical protein
MLYRNAPQVLLRLYGHFGEGRAPVECHTHIRQHMAFPPPLALPSAAVDRQPADDRRERRPSAASAAHGVKFNVRRPLPRDAISSATQFKE